jgi:hypothetical protein
MPLFIERMTRTDDVVVPFAVSISVNTLSSTSPGSTTIWLPMVWFVGPGS